MTNFKLSQILSQSSEYKNKEYYCASLDDVYNIIEHSVMEFSNGTNDAITQQIQEDDLHYDHKITVFSDKLKNIALKEFGENMYNILNLLDNYLRFNQFVEQILDENLDDIDNQLLTIKIELPHLKRNIARLKELCFKKCLIKTERAPHKKLLGNPVEEFPFTGRPTFKSPDPRFTLQDSENVLETLLIEIQKDILGKAHLNYLEIYEELNEKLNIDDTEMENKYLPILKEISKEIQGLTENAVYKFNELRSETAEYQIEDIKFLSRNFNALHEDVKNMKIEVHEMIQKVNRLI